MANDNDHIDDSDAGDLADEDKAFVKAVIDPEEAIRLLEEMRKEPEIECAHCGGVPDGVLKIETDLLTRDHRICNPCAIIVLGWL